LEPQRNPDLPTFPKKIEGYVKKDQMEAIKSFVGMKARKDPNQIKDFNAKLYLDGSGYFCLEFDTVDSESYAFLTNMGGTVQNAAHVRRPK